MKRNIISIDENKCVGCGVCINACHQGALQLINGKVKLISESYCDGLGKCLPNCPTGALKVIEKDVLEFNHNKKEKKTTVACGCPSIHSREINRSQEDSKQVMKVNCELRQWPCQIQLVPVNAPYFEGAKLLVAADCTAFANANVHSKFMKDRITLIGCPKLDEVDYSKKLTEIIKNNDIKSIEVLRMSVPCCRGIEHAVKTALTNSEKMISCRTVVISPDGQIME